MPKKIANLEATILKEARTLFETYGYEKVDIKQIAAAAGTSAGNLYNYFPSKEELFCEAIRKWQLDLNEDLEAVPAMQTSAAEKIRKVLDTIYEHVSRHKGVWQEFMKDQHPSAKMHTRLEKYKKRNVALLADLVEQAALENGDTDMAAEKLYWAQALIMTHIIIPIITPGPPEADRSFLHHYLEKVLPSRSSLS